MPLSEKISNRFKEEIKTKDATIKKLEEIYTAIELIVYMEKRLTENKRE